MLKEPTCESLSAPFVYWMSLFQCVMSPGREKPTEEKNVVKNSSGVLIKFYWGQKEYLLKDHGLAWGIETQYLPRTNAAPVHPSSWGHSKIHLKFQSSRDRMQYLTRWAGTTWQRYRLQTWTKWFNNYTEARQLINLFTPKTKERDIRKYGKPHLTKILFSAIWIHCPLILSNIL